MLCAPLSPTAAVNNNFFKYQTLKDIAFQRSCASCLGRAIALGNGSRPTRAQAIDCEKQALPRNPQIRKPETVQPYSPLTRNPVTPHRMRKTGTAP